ncbi:uncharacterized protein LY79DRAFT_554782 [Colletotrichum navitas]|uniref:Uncharacterized protein n=1 Tax=Colletotrichum navitas TaxID=681940 RepID=A0AAD8PYJ9_9PEZI|nr:uncharacterized protein LY79DRAFT_554782 [Colletotrichum navitas]KAK1590489.1 hypothetical protein LY79DRAFT_554782 [Colletotrichum navitas]
MGFNKYFGLGRGAASPSLDQHGAMPSTELENTLSGPKTDRDSSESDLMASKCIKIAVAAYSIERRVLETLHDTLQASLREEHAMDLWRFKRSLRDHAVNARTKRHWESDRKVCTGQSCFDKPASYEECARSACTYVHQKLAIAKFMVLQAKERTAAAKECNEQLDGLRKEFGDCIMPGRNGGVKEEDCASERHALLVDWGLTNTSTKESDRSWENDLRDMVRLSVSEEREEKAKSRRTTSTKSKEAGRVSASIRPRRLSVVLESSEED